MHVTNVNNIESSTRNNTRNYTGRKNKRKFNETTSNEKSNKSCYLCGKKGHFKRDWKFKKKLKFGNSDTTNKANLVEQKNNEIVAMVSQMRISMIS